jgi:hypothetical protein
MVVDGAGVPSAAACFGDAFNETIIISGKLRTKDFVSHPPLPLGIETPSLLNNRGPQIHINNQLIIHCDPAWVVVTGSTVPNEFFHDLMISFPGAVAGAGPVIFAGWRCSSSNPASDILISTRW